MIPFCTKLDTCILDGCVEADHDQVGFGEDIIWKGVDIPIVGMFTGDLIIGTFPNILVREGNKWFSIYLA